MKKVILNWMTILMVAVVSVSFVSCGDDNDDDKKSNHSELSAIIGTWTFEERHDGYSLAIMYIFKPDGTYKLIAQELDYPYEESGTWVYDINDHRLTLKTIVGEKPGLHYYTVILQGNQMTFIYADGDVEGPFIKQ